MVDPGFLDALLQPLSLYVLALGAGFLIPLFFRANRDAGVIVFIASLAGMVLIAGYNLYALLHGAGAMEIETAGIEPPFSINLRFGLYEGYFVFAVNLVALLGAWHMLDTLRHQSSSLLLYLILVMGIDGMVMTRDLFNLFIFIEITALATYSLIGIERSAGVLSAGFKYIIATSVASAFFLLGTIFLYYLTGTLNIDDMIAHHRLISGSVGAIATLFVLTSLIIELKPYPANGWGLDVYENAPTGIASMVSVGISAGILFALYKLMVLFNGYLASIAVIGAGTFLISNVIGLKQDNARRLLGYSSIGQMGLLMFALAAVYYLDIDEQLPLIVGGLFLNHLLAKAGLFWLAGVVDRSQIQSWSVLAGRPLLLLVFGTLLAALIGLPPFPGFWAKWALVMQLGSAGEYGWIVPVMIGSLLEAAYLFRWFSYARTTGEGRGATVSLSQLAPPAIATVFLVFAGYYMATAMNVADPVLFLPLFAGSALWLIDGLGGRLKAMAMLALVAAGGYWITKDLDGVARIFAAILFGGGVLLSVATLYRDEQRRGFFPLLAILLLSLASLLRAQTTLEFFFGWELMTLSSYLLITLGRDGVKPGLAYLLFSLGSAFFVMGGFALAYAATGSFELAALGRAGDMTGLVFSLLAIGFLIKIGGLGVHVWLPGAYAEADDDFSALLSAVVSKAGIFGLVLVAGELGVSSATGLDPGYVLGWIGMLTATFGALMAVFQEDLKKTLAYSSMGQIGYIVAGIALMNHLGWVSALYITVNHMLFKGILFLSAAGVIMRTGERMMYKMGGLIKNMPFTFVLVTIAIIAMSGVPPLTGFGGKWILFNAMMDKGWHWLAALAFFSSAVAFLYMYRILHTVFLGQRKLEHHDLREAPWTLLAPQFALAAVILLFSAYPKLLLDPLSAAIAPWVSGELVWNGLSLQTHLGYWNAPMTMGVIAGVWLVPLSILLLASMTIKIQKVGQFNIVYAAERPDRPEDTHFAWNFFAHYDRALGFLVRPRATAFWETVTEWSRTTASVLRIFYTGNGQTYALYILIYFAALYLVNGGLSP